MSAIIFNEFQWSGAFTFLLGPTAALIILWSLLEAHKQRKRIGLGLGSVLLIAFALLARPVEYGQIEFQSIPAPGASESGGLQKDYEEIIAQATRTRKPVLFYFHADWCSNCDELKRRLERKDILDRLDSFLLVSVDVTDERDYDEARQIFGLGAVPALSFFHPGNPGKPLLSGTNFPESALIGILESIQDEQSNRAEDTRRDEQSIRDEGRMQVDSRNGRRGSLLKP